MALKWTSFGRGQKSNSKSLTKDDTRNAAKFLLNVTLHNVFLLFLWEKELRHHSYSLGLTFDYTAYRKLAWGLNK